MIKPAARIGLLLCLASLVRAQSPSAQAGDDPLGRFLYSPELVMAHQQAIGLTDRQRTAIQAAMKDAQGKMIDVQFKMSQEVEKLLTLIQGTSVDQAKVLDQVDRVLTLEREAKHAQLTLMIQVKNNLTAQQQTALGKLRGPAPGAEEGRSAQRFGDAFPRR